MHNPASDQFTIGLSHHRAGRLDDADRFYRKALDADPLFPGALINLAALNLDRGDLSEAETLLDRARTANPDDAKVLANLGNLCANQGRTKEAEAYYLSAIKSSPTLAAPYCNLGALQIKQNEYKKAADTLAEAVRLEPSSHEALTLLGTVLFKLEKFNEAERNLKMATILDPGKFESQFSLGTCLAQREDFVAAEERFRNSVNLRPDWVVAITELAKVIHKQNRLEDAATYFRAALHIDPNFAPALASYGIMESEAKNYGHAEELLSKAIENEPKDPNLQLVLGNVLIEKGDLTKALECFEALIDQDPSCADAHLQRGITLQQLRRHSEAIECFKMLISKQTNFHEAHNNLGNCYSDIDRCEDAIISYDAAIQSCPTHAVAYINKGNVLRSQGRYEEALKVFEEAASVDKTDPRAYNGIGVVYQTLNNEAEAIKAYSKAHEIQPKYPEALNNLAVSQQNLGLYQEALNTYFKLVEQHPDISKVYFNLGSLLQLMGRFDESVIAYKQALNKDAENNLVYPYLAHGLMQQCSWKNLDAVVSRVIKNCENELESEASLSVSPFGLQSLPASKEIRHKVAMHTSKAAEKTVQRLVATMPPFTFSNAENSKLKIGFVSPDFRQHSVAHAFQGVLRERNSEKFEYHAYAITTYGFDSMTDHLKNSFDSFTDITHLPHTEAATRIIEDGIHILIDLAGHTRGMRYEIFALRSAPIQAHWLGFSSTTGASYFDYLITDKVQNPLDEQNYVTETLVHLPHTFMATSRPPLAQQKFSRADCDLPNDGFVFANFNSHYKFYPSMFAIWMRLLKQIPDSVLWLVEGSNTARENLQKEATNRGVDSTRLIFAKPLPNDQHIARIELADLCLDNQYHGGGVTTTDALWVGTPVLTMCGDTPPARNGATLLTAIDMPELITYSLRDYENKALQLANNPALLRDIRKKLKRHRDTKPLFDTKKLTADLEKSFELMWQNYNAGKVSSPIIVPSG